MTFWSRALKVTPSGGSETIRVVVPYTNVEGPTCQIFWFTVDNPDDFVEDYQQASGAGVLSIVLNTSPSSFVAGFFGRDSNSAPSFFPPTGTTQAGTTQGPINNDHQMVWQRSAAAGPATTTTVTLQFSMLYPTLFGYSLKEGSGSTTHDSSGSLVGPGAVVAGTAARTRAHPSSGVLVGPGSVVVGSAQHNVPHASSGALVGPGSTVSGSAARTRQHGSSGDLTGPGSVVSGSANRTRVHPTSGDLTGPGSALSGSAARTRVHPSSGALVGPGSVLDGAAARTRVHPASGDLVGQGAVIVGAADRQGAAGVHDTTGALVGQGSAVAGAAARLRAFATSGALVGQGALIAGSAVRVAGPVSHATTGVLVGAGSEVVGSAARVGAAVSHDTSGVLVGPGALVSGSAKNGTSRRHAGTRKNYIIKGKKYALTDYELALLIQQMLDEVKRPEIQVVTAKEIKQVSRRVWKRLKESLSSLEALTLEKVETVVESNVIEYDDEDDEELLMLL